MNRLLTPILLVIYFCNHSLSAYEENDYEASDFCCRYPSQCLTLGPQVYHSKRIKKGGTEQHGVLYGLQLSYDHIKRYNLYWGLEGSYAEGKLHGESVNGSSLVSHLTDTEVEARLGYTFQEKNGFQKLFTPFVGVGYFDQTNHFCSPSPIRLHFRDSFKYGVAGFLTRILLTEDFRAGAIFKAKFMHDGKSKVSHDPDFPDSTLIMAERTQYSLDLLFTYLFCCSGFTININVVPFFQYRHYGGRENYPFDLIETKYINLGSKLTCECCF